ncbi:MAG: M20 family metallo-hydrolase, partial [Bacteroidales bacterium]|nr:M20 family metallo-hydrolase [Bacteroidales bacterium]
MKQLQNKYVEEATALLRKLVSLPSFSGEEDLRVDYFTNYFSERNVETEHIGNNIIVKQPHFNALKPTFMLNSHIDTV